LARKHQSDRNAYSNAKTEFVLGFGSHGHWPVIADSRVADAANILVESRRSGLCDGRRPRTESGPWSLLPVAVALTWGETIFFDNASLLKQIGAEIEIPLPTGAKKPAAFILDDTSLLGHGEAFE